MSKGSLRRQRLVTKAKESLGWARTYGTRCFDCHDEIDPDEAILQDGGDWLCDACLEARLDEVQTNRLNRP